MRHRKSGRKLNRTGSSRGAMLRNMVNALVEHERVQTTLPKAKELRRFAEPLITAAKEDSVNNRRLVFKRTRSTATVSKLFGGLAARFVDRPGGYLRVLKAGFRRSDAAPMAWVLLGDGLVAGASSVKKEKGAGARPQGAGQAEGRQEKAGHGGDGAQVADDGGIAPGHTQDKNRNQ